MAVELYANGFVTTLASPMGAGDLTAVLTDTPIAPLNAPGQWRLRIDNEIMLVTSVAGAVCTVVRAAESYGGAQAAAAHAAGAAARCVLTAGALPLAGPPAQQTPPVLWLDADGDDAMPIPGPQGATGPAGATGATGPTGPNSISGSTATALAGILTGNGANVAAVDLGAALAALGGITASF